VAAIDPQPTSIMPAFTASTTWRRIALEKQLPRTRFPAGVAVPGLMSVVGLVVLAGLCVVVLGRPSGRVVEAATRDSQERLVTDLAHGVATQATRTSRALAAVAARYDAAGRHDPAVLLAAAETATPRWDGGVVVNAVTRNPVAARGNAVATTVVPRPLDGPNTYAVPSAADIPRFVTALPLADGTVLIVSSTIVVRPLRLDTASRQGVLVAIGTDHVSYSQGVKPSDDAGALITRTIGDIDGPRAASREHTERATSTITGPTPAPGALVVSAAPTGVAGVSVVSLIHTTLVDRGSWWTGVPAALALLGVTALVAALIWSGLVLPVRRLLERAKLIASGGKGSRARYPRTAEVFRIALAFDDVGARLRGQRTKVSREPRFFSGGKAVVAAGVAILVWAGVVGYHFTFQHETGDVPGAVVVAHENLVTGAAEAVRDALLEGLSFVSSQAERNLGSDVRHFEPVVADLARDPRFRSVYVVDQSGRVMTLAGSRPLRPETALPAGNGLDLDDTAGRVPAIFAHAWASRRFALVAEFDVTQLRSVLARSGGHLRLVDDRMRTIIDTSGYIAFAPLPAGVLRDLATHALGATATGGVVSVSGIRSLVNAAEFDWQGVLTPLRWVVLGQVPVSQLALRTNQIRRSAWLVSMLGICVALLLLLWHYFMLIRPLRSLADTADRLRAGDTGTVVAPSRLDEIGAIAICLDVCRQAQVHGAARLGGAIRMRGDSGDHTTVMSRIPAQRTDSPAIEPDPAPRPRSEDR
jgi:HAMP domain-containing protein